MTALSSLDEIGRARGSQTLVFTNGVFDVLHAGHVSYLTEAKKLGGLLVVGLNSDASAKRLGKGPGRPVHSLEDRAVVVAALRCVDFVVSFDDDTPVELIRRLRPDVHVKGGDYKVGDLPEAEVVRDYGGKVVILPYVAGLSTTLALKKLSSSEAED